MSSTTLVRNVARLLGDLPLTDKLTASAGASYTSLTVASDATDRWEAGQLGDFLDDNTYDIFRVTAVAATSLTVDGGLLGSTQAAHANAARFRKQPRFWAFDIDKALDDALFGDLYPDLFAIYEAQIAPSATNVYYSIAAAAEEVLACYQKPDTGNDLLYLSGWSQPVYVDTTLSATGKAIRIPTTRHATATVFVQYLRIPQVTDLSEGMTRIVEYGACARLLDWEAGRVLGDADIDQSGSRVPGQWMRDARWYRAEQDMLKRQERAILNRRFPKRVRNWFPGQSNRSGTLSYFNSIGHL